MEKGWLGRLRQKDRAPDSREFYPYPKPAE